MIKVYWLPVLTDNNTDTVEGISSIHDAILNTTSSPTMRILIMDTTSDEHNYFLTVSMAWREATPEEVALYHSQVIVEAPNPDIVRALELLETSPAVITMPEMWELMRIYGRLHGINP